MCFGSKDNGAAAAAAQQTAMMEAQQAKHDKAVADGKVSIDEAFKQFDQPYFDAYGQAYKDKYNPELDNQYGIAKDKLISLLAGRDVLDSTVGANALARQSKTYQDTQADIANKATDATNSLKTQVDNTKGNLYATNQNVADPLTMASQAQAQAGALVSPQSYPTLSNIFADSLSSFATANKANAQSTNPDNVWAWNRNSAPSGNGSAIFSM